MKSHKDTIETQIKALAKPIETITMNQIDAINNEHMELMEKMKALSAQVDQLLQLFPKTDLTQEINKLNSICDRFENCKKRVQRVTARAEKLLSTLPAV